MKTTNVYALQEILKENFTEYLKETLKQDKTDVFEKSYETAVKREIAYYSDLKCFGKHEIRFLSSIKNPLEFLYQEYLRSGSFDIKREIDSFLIYLSQTGF